ncbi:hypothetical protein AGDE_13790 [Angomonas deanei]|uniref:Uncharacterized protein n=1 Tax=Angomonas deanei TaxID=59799 RepID=A0A7G2CTG9_9TRYP|nr:hypothetical protein AGDE_13790 [Angomonas deanei]CAD2222815.1 hypothetical protein, conserved [Angomonas deanei]|eukprot:EPY21780.1 hypothetical protein AGDE_13790 [Angomonas deanei]
MPRPGHGPLGPFRGCRGWGRRGSSFGSADRGAPFVPRLVFPSKPFRGEGTPQLLGNRPRVGSSGKPSAFQVFLPFPLSINGNEVAVLRLREGRPLCPSFPFSLSFFSFVVFRGPWGSLPPLRKRPSPSSQRAFGQPGAFFVKTGGCLGGRPGPPPSATAGISGSAGAGKGCFGGTVWPKPGGSGEWLVLRSRLGVVGPHARGGWPSGFVVSGLLFFRVPKGSRVGGVFRKERRGQKLWPTPRAFSGGAAALCLGCSGRSGDGPRLPGKRGRGFAARLAVRQNAFRPTGSPWPCVGWKLAPGRNKTTVNLKLLFFVSCFFKFKRDF